jgi:hypothetical protein
MRSSALANRPQGPRPGGFFEIWFLVVFAPHGGRAWWLRYTTFVPARNSSGAPRATLWAAAFDAAAAEPAIAVKDVRSLAAYSAGDGFAVRIGDATLTNGTARGAIAAGGHEIAWDLRFTPAAYAARRAPWLLDHLPLPTRVAHANGEIHCDGSIVVDGARHDLAAAPAVQKHIWGTRRVEELYWLYCPCFDGRRRRVHRSERGTAEPPPPRPARSRRSGSARPKGDRRDRARRAAQKPRRRERDPARVLEPLHARRRLVRSTHARGLGLSRPARLGRPRRAVGRRVVHGRGSARGDGSAASSPPAAPRSSSTRPSRSPACGTSPGCAA